MDTAINDAGEEVYVIFNEEGVSVAEVPVDLLKGLVNEVIEEDVSLADALNDYRTSTRNKLGKFLVYRLVEAMPELSPSSES